MLDNVRTYSRFFFGFNAFLKKKMTLDEARQAVVQRQRDREERFLRIAQKGIFEYPRSPYLALFRAAGCAYEDVEQWVHEQGLEKTLKVLCGKGIYFTIEEFKGKKPVVRNGKSFIVREKDFDNPYVRSCFERRTGATRSAGTRVMVDFDFLTDTAAHRGIILDVWGLARMPLVLINPAVIYGTAVITALHLSRFGISPIKWFSFVDERRVLTSLRLKLGMAYILTMSRLSGAKFPHPEFCPLKDISPIVESVARTLQEHKECCIFTGISSALRVCQKAREKKISLKGVVFVGGGQPLTPVKRREIEERGASYVVFYAFTEGGLAGCLCRAPSTVDDMHLFSDSLALVSHKRQVMDSCVDAFLFTSLLPSAPKILLNVENGDYGEIESRKCGCPFEELGLHTHIHHVNSFEKLSGEGQTFYGSDLVRLVEEVLPARFGGNGLDYQLVEEEDEKGFMRLVVFVSPEVGPMDENKVIRTVLDNLVQKGDHFKVMKEIWSQAGTIRVRRQRPIPTVSGKLFPLYILPRGKNA